MQELVLVFLFTAGQVQYTSFGQETIAVTALADNEQNKAAFTASIKTLSERANVKVCAVVPSYDYASPLHKPLYDLLTEKIEKVPGIWEEHQGVQRVLKLPVSTVPTIEDAGKYCKLVARVAFR